MDDAAFTTTLRLHSGTSATSRLHCRALLDTGSPQSFIHIGAFENMVATDASYVRHTMPRSWSGFGSSKLLRTDRQARITVHFYHMLPTSTPLVPRLTLEKGSWWHFRSIRKAARPIARNRKLRPHRSNAYRTRSQRTEGARNV